MARRAMCSSQFKLNGVVVTNAADFTKDLRDGGRHQHCRRGGYASQNLSPLVQVVSANIPSPVGATTNFILTLQFDRTMNSAVEPLVVLTNGLTAQPLNVSTGGVWTTTTLSNDTYVTPRLTFTPTSDGTNRVRWVSQAQDLCSAWSRQQM